MLFTLTDDERLYGFVRVDTGDELSKRVKFVLVTWVGVNVSALKRAKMSIDKAIVKTAITVRTRSHSGTNFHVPPYTIDAF